MYVSWFEQKDIVSIVETFAFYYVFNMFKSVFNH